LLLVLYSSILYSLRSHALFPSFGRLMQLVWSQMDSYHSLMDWSNLCGFSLTVAKMLLIHTRCVSLHGWVSWHIHLHTSEPAGGARTAHSHTFGFDAMKVPPCHRTMIVSTYSSNWRLWACEIGNALGGNVCLTLEENSVVVNLQAVNLQAVNLLAVNLQAVNLQVVNQ